jgi:hypothetical protein
LYRNALRYTQQTVLYMKPLLFMDVDDVLNLRSKHAYHEYLLHVDTAKLSSSPFTNHFSGEYVDLTVRFDSRYPGWMSDLTESFEIVWATTWENAANLYLSELLGLGELGVVEFSKIKATEQEVADLDVASWKWRGLLAYAHGRPFVFVDDQATALEKEHPVTHGSSPGVIAPYYGLTEQHVKRLLSWAKSLPASNYDLLSEDEQALVRETWATKMDSNISTLNYKKKFKEEARPYAELDETASVVIL